MDLFSFSKTYTRNSVADTDSVLPLSILIQLSSLSSLRFTTPSSSSINTESTTGALNYQPISDLLLPSSSSCHHSSSFPSLSLSLSTLSLSPPPQDFPVTFVSSQSRAITATSTSNRWLRHLHHPLFISSGLLCSPVTCSSLTSPSPSLFL